MSNFKLKNICIHVAGLSLLLSTGTSVSALLDANTLTQMIIPLNDPGLPDRIQPVPVAGIPGANFFNFAGTWDGTSAPASWKGGNWTAVGRDFRGPTHAVLIEPTFELTEHRTTYDFSAISGLPASTYFTVGDLDAGSGGPEEISYTAFSNGVLITDPWLDLLGTNATSNNELPSYSWDTATGTYFFDGTSVPGNPNVAFTMTSLVSIDTLTVRKLQDSYSYNISAPASAVPIPSAVWLFGSGLLGLIGVSSRKAKT